MRALRFIRGHVIFKLRYDQIYQMKTTLDLWTKFGNSGHSDELAAELFELTNS